MNAHGVILVPAIAYCAAYQILHVLRPDLGAPHLLTGFFFAFLTFMPLLFLGLAMKEFYRIARHEKPDSPIRALGQALKKFVTNPVPMAHGLPVLLVVCVIAFIFSDIQSNTFTLNPNGWDKYFAELDRTLHFGKQPWEWLQPVFGYAPITFLLNLNYNLWYISMIVILIHFAFAEHASPTRTQFLISYIALWVIVGNVLAVIFASGGPCYYSRLTFAPDPFDAQMEYLRHVNQTLPLWAVSLQDLLWTGHVRHVEGSVISAMPSLHNGSAMLFALAGYQISRFWGHVLTAHAAFIFIGSIHLAWHYAIDSYVSWAVTLLIWILSGYIARWWHGTKSQIRFENLIAS